MTIEQGRRDRYWDAVKGALIVVVVWIHSTSGAGFQGGLDEWNFDYWMIARQALNFPVAFFLFLAGYFIQPGPSLGYAWVKRRSARLLVPFGIWAVAYAALDALRANGIGNPVEFAARAALGLTAPHLYFIVVLAQLTLLTPLATRLLRTRQAWLMFAVTPAYIGGLYVVVASMGGLPGWYATAFAGWSIFYVAGMWVRVHGIAFTGAARWAIAVAVALAASVAESFALVAAGAPVAFAVSQLGATSIVYSLTVIALTFALKPSIEARTPARLAFLGGASYGIYYVHMIWMFAAHSIAERALDAAPVLPLIQVGEVVFVIALSLATIMAGRLLLGRARAQRLLGF